MRGLATAADSRPSYRPPETPHPPLRGTFSRKGRRKTHAGYLRCGAAPVRPVPPVPPVGGGGGSFEAIAYTSANFGGRQLRIREPIANLGNFPGFNDNIRSIRILRGRAEVCTDARYRGQCRTISQSVGDLNRIGMGNRISSIR